MVGSRQAWSRNDISVTSTNRSGTGRVEQFAETNTSAAFTDVELSAKVNWSASRGMDAGTMGYSADDLTEVGMRVGLLGEPMPSQLSQMGFLAPAEDPLAELETLHIPEGAVQPLARLLVVEALVGSARASAVEHFALGPKDAHQRHLELSWWEPRRYSNREPALRAISGVRRWP